jgi:hypothetical protein
MDTIDVVALQPLMVPAGQIAAGETFATTEQHAAQLEGLGLVKRPTKKAAEKAAKAD